MAETTKKKTTKATNAARTNEKMELLKKRLKGSLVTGEDFTPKEWLFFGVPELDEVLSNGKGFPRGIVMEVCGKSQAGKTKVCYDAIAWCHQNGIAAAFVNVENGFYDERAIEQGVAVKDENLFAMLDGCVSAEEYAEGIKAMVESELFALIVVDSISGMVPADELAKEYGANSTLGIHARFVKKLTNELNQLCKKHNTTVIFINQFKAAQSKMPGKFVDKPTGGASLEHNSRVRIWAERVPGKNGFKLDAKGNRIGGYTKLHVMKGNYGGQDAEVVVEIPFVKADGDPIGEFFFKLRAQAKFDLKDSFKDTKATAKKPRSIRYICPDTGAVEVDAETEVDFIRGLLNTAAPERFVKAGKGESALDYVGSKIKLYDGQKKVLIEALDAPAYIAPAAEVSDDDVLEGGLDLTDEADEEAEGDEE